MHTGSSFSVSLATFGTVFLLQLFYWAFGFICTFLKTNEGASGKEPSCQCMRQETWVRSLGWEDPLKEGMASHSSIFGGESHGQRTLMGYSPWGRTELETTEAT